MASIKGVNRLASVELALDAPYMAMGTMAGVVDLLFSLSASLEIFKLDFQSDNRELPLVGEAPSSESLQLKLSCKHSSIHQLTVHDGFLIE